MPLQESTIRGAQAKQGSADVTLKERSLLREHAGLVVGIVVEPFVEDGRVRS